MSDPRKSGRRNRQKKVARRKPPDPGRGRRVWWLAAILVGAGIGVWVLAQSSWDTGANSPERNGPSVASQRESRGATDAIPEKATAPPEPVPLPVEPGRATPEIEAPSPEPWPAVPMTIEALKSEELQVARRLMEDFPNNPNAIGLMGMVLNSHGNSAEATKCWERCVQLDPRRADVYNGMGMAALLKGDHEKAVVLWRKTLELNPRMPGVHNRLGRALMTLARPEEAAPVLQQAVKTFPKVSESRFLLGQAYLQMKEYEKAKESYQAAIEIQPDHYNACYGLASTYARLGQRDKSKQYLEKFKTLKANELQVRVNQAKTFDDMALAREKAAQTHTDAGRVYRWHGSQRNAETHWQRAAEIDPENTVCRMELVSLYRSDHREREGLQICEELRKIQPGNAMVHLHLGLLNASLNRLDAAEQAFKEVLALAPQRPWGYRPLAQLYLRTDKNLAGARTLAQTAVQLEPSAPNYFVLSQACQKNGDLAGALAAVERAVELDPRNPEYRRTRDSFKHRK